MRLNFAGIRTGWTIHVGLGGGLLGSKCGIVHSKHIIAVDTDHVHAVSSCAAGCTRCVPDSCTESWRKRFVRHTDSVASVLVHSWRGNSIAVVAAVKDDIPCDEIMMKQAQHKSVHMSHQKKMTGVSRVAAKLNAACVSPSLCEEKTESV
jgi:hypothetical protein